MTSFWIELKHPQAALNWNVKPLNCPTLLLWWHLFFGFSLIQSWFRVAFARYFRENVGFGVAWTGFILIRLKLGFQRSVGLILAFQWRVILSPVARNDRRFYWYVLKSIYFASKYMVFNNRVCIFVNLHHSLRKIIHFYTFRFISRKLINLSRLEIIIVDWKPEFRVSDSRKPGLKRNIINVRSLCKTQNDPGFPDRYVRHRTIYRW